MSRLENPRGRHVHRHRASGSVVYPVSLSRKLYALVWYPLISIIVVSVALMIYNGSGLDLSLRNTGYSVGSLVLAVLSTLLRVFVSYVLAVAVSLPLAVLATRNRFSETIFLPLFDILQSVPVLAFSPLLVVFFVRYSAFNSAAIFILFLTMLWSLIFTMIGGLRIIPKDIKEAAEVFGVRGWSYFRKVLMPAVFPEFVTGSILSAAAGWNIIIVAEALHNYIPNGKPSQDLFGIGSILVHSASTGETGLFVVALTFLILTIAFINFFLWQKLLHYSSKFRFE
jgi:NitT/TauT family transport system permease protein